MFEDLWDAFQLFRISLHCHWCFCFLFYGTERRLRCSTFRFQFHLSIPFHSGSNSSRIQCSMKMRWNHLLRFCACGKLIIRFARNWTGKCCARWRNDEAAFVVHWYIAPEMKENKFSQSTMPFIYLFSLRLTTNICFGRMAMQTHEQASTACMCASMYCTIFFRAVRLLAKKQKRKRQLLQMHHLISLTVSSYHHEARINVRKIKRIINAFTRKHSLTSHTHTYGCSTHTFRHRSIWSMDERITDANAIINSFIYFVIIHRRT